MKKLLLPIILAERERLSEEIELLRTGLYEVSEINERGRTNISHRVLADRERRLAKIEEVIAALDARLF